MNVLEDCVRFFVWAPWILFNFHLTKSKDIQSGALLKVSTSFPFMEKICLDIQK